MFDKNYYKIEKNDLEGRRIFALGSSIFYGFGNEGYSFVDMIRDDNFNTEVTKETVNGTTLANLPNRNDSYVQRLEKKVSNNKDKGYITKDDILLVQLSTNDFFLNVPEGDVSNTDIKDLSEFDTSTISGAIEYIIGYARKLNPSIKIALISCPALDTRNKKSAYKKYNDEMVPKIISKWNIDFIDLLNYKCANESYYKVDKTNTSGYFFDDIHPNMLGYSRLIYPLIKKYLETVCSDSL